MPIINKGIFNINSAYLRDVGNDWPTAQVTTTSDIVESSSNLYFTAARVNATVQPFLTTANVVETSGNLYFTNARVFNALTIGTIEGDISVSGNLVANGLIIRNIAVSDAVLTGNISAAGFTGNSIVVDIITANIWNRLYTANVIETSGNLYFTNARVVSALIAGDQIIIEANGRISANVSQVSSVNSSEISNLSNISLLSNVANTVLTLSNFTTANLVESSANLYFTNTRAISAFTAGKGIVIQENGLIKTATAPTEFNLYIDGSAYGNVLSTMSTMVTMPSSTATDRFILRSIHVTNISNGDALLSGNVLYATGNTAILVNQMPIPAGGVVDLIRRGQLLNPGDKINLQGFNSSGVATSNLLSAMFTYETFTSDISYIGIGETLASSNTNILIYDSPQSASIIESIKIVNLVSYNVPTRLYWADANDVIKTHLAYNLSIPSNSSVELLSNPKRIEKTDRLYAYYTNAESGAISVFTSARLGATYSLSSYSANITPGTTFTSAVATTEAEGTVLYYTIE